MHPIIVKIGPITIYSYGLMLAIAFIAGVYVARLEARRKDIRIDLVYDLAFYLVVGALIGARLYYITFFDPLTFIYNPLSIFKIWEGGLAVHGGILGGIGAVILFSVRRKVSFWRMADMASPSIILAQAIGRLGCFLNGCCYGIPTDSIFKVRFPEGSLPYLAYGGLPVHPTQLYELVLDLIGFFVLWTVRKKTHFDGALFLMYLMVYNSIRIVVSSLRGDSLYIWNTNLKVAQIISGIIFVIALSIYITRQKKSA